MVYALYTLKRQYRDKKIFIWNINRDSMVIFTKAVFGRINIDGFVTLQKEYAGETYMNRPVISLKQMSQSGDYVVLVSDKVSGDKISMLRSDKILYWSDALEIDAKLQNRKIMVYGTGWGADKLQDELTEAGIKTGMYCVTKMNDVAQYHGKMVIEASELEKYNDYTIILSVVTEQYIWEILKTLAGYQGEVYVDAERIITELDIIHVNLIQSLDFAIKRNSAIYLYSEKNAMAEWIEDALSVYGILINGYVHEREDKDQNIAGIFELGYEGTEDKLIIMNEYLPQNIIRGRENIELAGFSLEQRNYTGIQWYIRGSEKRLLEYQESLDTLVGGSILYTSRELGWKIYGKEEAGRVRIVVLGGSTSSEVYYPETWISKLYYKLEARNIKTVIYNGAHTGNDIVSEILRLLRDGYVLQPDIVISMSGVNNLYYKDCVNQFNEERLVNWVKHASFGKKYCSGIESDESLYSFWNRNEMLLKLIAEFYGAQFFGFLQPMNFTMDHMSLSEKSLYEMEARIEGARDFAKSACDSDGYINLMRLFEHQDEMFFDIAHYTDKAHGIIADKVYEAVLSAVCNCLK